MDRPDPISFPPAPEQQQFLRVLSREEALARWQGALQPGPLGREAVPLAAASGRVLAADIASRIDVPPFDRALVDGFAVRAADLRAAGETSPVRLRLTGEVIACGDEPGLPVGQGAATAIATGAPLPRGADAVVMIEHTDPAEDDRRSIEVRRSTSPGSYVAFAGSDITDGETVARRGTLIGPREVGVLAACGIGSVEVWRKPVVSVLSTGNELVTPGDPLRPAAIYDSNGPMIAAAVAGSGGAPVLLGTVPDDEAALRTALARAFAANDVVILSAGTSKGAGDLTHSLVGELGAPGIVAHGVALKPGKPLLLAVCDGKPVIVLPGFPTSAMFTFHDMVAPVLRQLAGLPPRAEAQVSARLPVRITSELGRTEFVMVSLVEAEDGLVAYPIGKGSGAVTSFSQADGFVTVEALADALPAGTETAVTLLSPSIELPDVTVMGSHCVGLDAVASRVAEAGLTTRIVAIGSQGGLAAARRGECDLAPIHLADPGTGLYNRPYLTEGLELIEGWRRLQGVLFRPGDGRFERREARAAIGAVLTDPDAHMVNRNAGSGTRILLDGLLGGARPEGYSNQPRSHNAVAAAIAQGRADWGLAIEPVARRYGLGFLPLADEHYDFALVSARRDRPGVQAFLRALADPGIRARLVDLGFTPAPSHQGAA